MWPLFHTVASIHLRHFPIWERLTEFLCYSYTHGQVWQGDNPSSHRCRRRYCDTAAAAAVIKDELITSTMRSERTHQEPYKIEPICMSFISSWSEILIRHSKKHIHYKRRASEREATSHRAATQWDAVRKQGTAGSYYKGDDESAECVRCKSSGRQRGGGLINGRGTMYNMHSFCV